MKTFLSLTYLCLILLLFSGCSSTKPKSYLALEQVLGVGIPKTAQNVQIEEQSRSNKNRVWWLKMEVPKDVAEAFLEDLKFEAKPRGEGQKLDPSITYENQPPEWWFSGFKAGKIYRRGVCKTSGGAHIIGYVDETKTEMRILHLDVRD